ncbi:hypothetical protein GE061_013625 [Apolygus lucorum]|uniref:Uncharacterized protein n=1 Tax=Apolygus lucorum TaxID=248454 RepID=A0A8S9XPJ9_APOLU|nr:hypothetical protein GE061_013625 [Apolygus lucorum]
MFLFPEVKAPEIVTCEDSADEYALTIDNISGLKFVSDVDYKPSTPNNGSGGVKFWTRHFGGTTTPIDTPVDIPADTSSHGIDIPVDTSSHGIDTPVVTSSHSIDTPVDTSSHGIDTPVDTSSHGIDTPVDTSSHGIDIPIDTSPHGIDTPIDTSPHGIGTPIDTLPHGIDTTIDTSPHDVDTPIDTSICRTTTPLELLRKTLQTPTMELMSETLQIGQSYENRGIPDETFIDPVDIKPTLHDTTTPAPVEEVPETERKDILEEYEWETRVKVEMPTSPSTSAHVKTPPDEAHALEGTSRKTSTRLNDSVGTDHLRDADHHFDRSSETQMTCAHDRQKDLCAREAQDRHDNAHDRHGNAHDRNDNARDRHDNAHDRHDNAHDRHDITRNRHDTQHDLHGDQHDQPEHRYDTSHHETDSEEEEFKDAENDPPRKRPKGDEPETPARYTLRKRESNVNYRQLHLGKRQTD